MKSFRFFSLIGIGVMLAISSLSVPAMASVDVLMQPSPIAIMDHQKPYFVDVAIAPAPDIGVSAAALTTVSSISPQAVMRPTDVSRLLKAKRVTARTPVPIRREPPAD